jgi:hypothetical protein
MTKDAKSGGFGGVKSLAEKRFLLFSAGFMANGTGFLLFFLLAGLFSSRRTILQYVLSPPN